MTRSFSRRVVGRTPAGARRRAGLTTLLAVGALLLSMPGGVVTPPADAAPTEPRQPSAQAAVVSLPDLPPTGAAPRAAKTANVSADQGDTGFVVSPASGPAGLFVTVTSTEACPVGGTNPSESVTLQVVSPTGHPKTYQGQVDAGSGSWKIANVMVTTGSDDEPLLGAGSLQPGAYDLGATCVDGDSSSTHAYEHATFVADQPLTFTASPLKQAVGGTITVSPVGACPQGADSVVATVYYFDSTGPHNLSYRAVTQVGGSWSAFEITVPDTTRESVLLDVDCRQQGRQVLFFQPVTVAVQGGLLPTRMVSFGDSYSSGEGLSGGSTSYDCATDMFPGQYYQDSSVEYGYFAGRGACDTRTLSTRLPTSLYSRPAHFYQNECHRAGTAYPNRIRSALKVSAKNSLFVACSGAVTTDVINTAQYPSSPVNVAGGRPQLNSALDFASAGGAPDFVTVGIGGNDAGFADILTHCLKYDRCSTDADFTSIALHNIRGSAFVLTRGTLARLHKEFPNAVIAAFGYPSAIGDPVTNCGGFTLAGKGFDSYGALDPGERAWLKNTVFTEVNSMVAKAAAEAGVKYIDISHVFDGHEICSKQPYANGIRYGLDDGLIPFAVESFHPNEAGHAAIANYFVKTYTADGRLIFGQPTARAWTTPSDVVTRLGQVDAGFQIKCGIGCIEVAACVLACSLTMRGAGFIPGSLLKLVLHSEPVDLGTVEVAEDGTFSTVVKLPKVPPGLHSVEVEGADAADGRQRATTIVQVFAKQPAPRTPLVLGLSAASPQVLASRRFKVKCEMTLRSTCTVRAKVKVGKHVYKAKVSGRPATGGFVSLRPRFSKSAASAIGKALKKKKDVRVDVTAGASVSGQSASAKTSIHLAR